jgi:hypothetical protein
MSRKSILSKLQSELESEITTERQVVYILAEIRKAIEQAGELENYFALDFYCSFALHTKMSKAGAKRILERFDRVHAFLVRKEEVPRQLQREIDQTIKLEKFRDELKQFLNANGLPNRLVVESDAWAKFLQLYGGIIDECELILKDEGGAQLKHLDRVVLSLDVAPEVTITEYGDQVWFRIRWICHDKRGGCGEHFVIFGYDPSSEPRGRQHSSSGIGKPVVKPRHQTNQR